MTKVGLRAGKPSTYVENTPDKIYIAGIPVNVTDEQLQELLEAFGALEAMCIVRDRGYAFCLYKDRSVTDAACAGLNGLQLGTQSLVVKRADVNARVAVPNINLSDPNVVSQMLPASAGLNSSGANVTESSNNSNFLITGNSQSAVVQSFGQPTLGQTAKVSTGPSCFLNAFLGTLKTYKDFGFEEYAGGGRIEG